MKKTFVLAIAALAVAGTLTLASCGSSNADVVKEYKELVDEAVAAQKSGDVDKAMEVMQKASKFYEDNKDRDFTEEEQKEMLEYASKAQAF